MFSPTVNISIGRTIRTVQLYKHQYLFTLVQPNCVISHSIQEYATENMYLNVYLLSNRLIVNYVPRAMDELPIRQSHSQPVNPSHVTINGLAHYCTHNASVDNSI